MTRKFVIKAETFRSCLRKPGDITWCREKKAALNAEDKRTKRTVMASDTRQAPPIDFDNENIGEN